MDVLPLSLSRLVVVLSWAPPPLCCLQLRQPRQLLHRLSGSLIHEQRESSSKRSLSSNENLSTSPSQSNIKSMFGRLVGERRNWQRHPCWCHSWRSDNDRLIREQIDGADLSTTFRSVFLSIHGLNANELALPCTKVIILYIYMIIPVMENGFMYPKSKNPTVFTTHTTANNNKSCRESSSLSGPRRGLAGAHESLASSLLQQPLKR